MKKMSGISLPVMVFLVCFLCSPSFGAANNVSVKRSKRHSSGVLQRHEVTKLADLPVEAREKISQQLQKAEYEVNRYEKKLPSGKTSAYRTFNRKQDMSVYFTDQSIHLIPNGKEEPAWQLEMSFSGYGYKGAAVLVPHKRPDNIKASGNRIEYSRGLLTEWYVNDERGFEQGITLSKPPVGSDTDPLVVEWTVSGTLKPRLEEDGTSISFCKTRDQSVLRYSGLKAWDATGRFLPAKLAVVNDNPTEQQFRIAYVVDTIDASYPVTIDPCFVKKIIASDAAGGDTFGYSISISGDTVVVGAPGDDDKGNVSGSAYIFERNHGGTDNWGQVTKITASDGDEGDQFGFSVATNGAFIIVGAPFDEDNGIHSGSAYMFYRDEVGPDNWGQVVKLTPNDPQALDQFGYSVALGYGVQFKTALVGAPYNDERGDDSGAAYLFDEGIQIKKLTASDGTGGELFGKSVAYTDQSFNWIVVGAPEDDNSSGFNAGSAYLFERDWGSPNSWGENGKIMASDGEANDYFGSSVAISGDTVIIGAPGKNNIAPKVDSGAAYVFKSSLFWWIEAKKLMLTDGSPYDYFGHSVSVSGDTVVVGVYGDNRNGDNFGSAYIYERNHGGTDNWGQIKKITASDGAENDLFGWSVFISGVTVVVGARWDDDNGGDSGSAYVYPDIYFCQGNFDCDNDVDGSDLAVFAAEFGRTDCGTGPPCEGDFEHDGDVDGSDLALFAADFGRTDCP